MHNYMQYQNIYLFYGKNEFPILKAKTTFKFDTAI